MDTRIKELTDKHYPLVIQTKSLKELEQRLRIWVDEVNSCALDEAQAVRQNEDAGLNFYCERYHETDGLEQCTTKCNDCKNWG